MRPYRRGRGAALLLAMLGAGTASAADYRFEFAPGVAAFEPGRAANAAALDALVPLLRDYHGVPGLKFVVVGELPADCAPSADCPARALLQRRVEALTAQLAARPTGAALVADLQWQAIDAAPAASADVLSLRVRETPPGAWSQHCPYQVSISDARLPPPIAPLGAEPSWVAMSASAAIPVASTTALRVRLEPRPRDEVAVDVIELTADQSLP